jgi:peroxiredoxin
LGNTTTDVWGNFSLSVNVKKTNYAFLALGLKKGDFYLEPGNNYHFQILDDTIKGSVYDQMPLQFNLDATNSALNDMIGHFNYEYNVFLFENQRNIIRAKDKSLVKNFIDEMKEKYADNALDGEIYLLDYVKYTLASLDWISKSKPDTAILKEFFVNQEILYNNIAYSDLFRDFFKEYFNTQKLYRYDELINAIRAQQMAKVDSLLLRDDLLAMDDQLRELALINLLARHFHNQDLAKEEILHLLSQLHMSAIQVENRRIAKNYIEKLTHLQYGSKAPAFELMDQNGQMVKLDDLKGQFVLLNFISTTCKPCLFDLKKLSDIQQSQGNKLKMVTIVSGGNQDGVAAFKAENNFNWLFLNLDEDIPLLESYQVKTFPAYFLLNPDASIAMAPAPPPNENLEFLIKGFMTRYSNTE